MVTSTDVTPDPDRTETVPPLPLPGEDVRLPPGTLISGRYEIRGPLGRGGHGTAYRVWDREVKREIALKILNRETPNALARLRREVQVARDAASPRLVRIFDLGTAPQGAYLTMELVEGPSLRDLLRKGHLPIEEALHIGAQLLEGLAALHALSIVHRDVKPGNVLLGEGKEVKLADFGLARRLDRSETQVTRSEVIAGTLDYLSPEQILRKEVRSESDLYAAGLVIFEMLAGRLPHDAASRLGRFLAPLQRAPNLRTFRPEVPRWLAEIVARLLEVDPADRYRSAEAVLGDLKAHCSPPPLRLRLRLRRRLMRAAAIVFLCLPQVGVLVTRPPEARFSHLVPLGESRVAAVGSKGERLWTIDGVNSELADRAALVRLTPHGPRLIAAVLVPPGSWLPDDISTLSFLDPATGRVVKKVQLPVGVRYFMGDPTRFNPESIKAIDLFNDGVDEILISYTHVPEAPSYTVFYSPRHDRARIIFYGRGHQRFQEAVDLDGNGSPELIFAGINNGWNWVNVVAAVELEPWPWTEQDWRGFSAAAPDVIENLAQERRLLWYAPIPRGHLESPHCLTINEDERELVIRYASGATWRLGFDGFPPGTTRVPEGEEARRSTYRHFREAERLRQAGALDLAMAEARAAYQSAKRAQDVWLMQYAERLEAKFMVVEGKIDEAEARLVSLTKRAEDAPEVAYDAAVAFHLHGDLRRAVAWYRRGMGHGSHLSAGKSKHEFLKGEILALVEEKRYEEALSAVERFGATYPPWQDRIWLFREYVRWRAGERPQVDPGGVLAYTTDLERYWAFEFEFAAGGEPEEILPRLDRFLRERPETRAEALSLRAELLAQLGRRQEAREAAQSALELVRAESLRSIVARGHADLVLARVLQHG